MREICPILELRRYALRPGARDTLIELFDRELVESQEAVGMQILGQFRDLDDPDSFVWLRGFPDMQSRRAGLEAFYGGPVWKRHAQAANATMLDVDNVLLLRPISGLQLDNGRPEPGSQADQAGLLVITIYPLAGSTSPGFPDLYAREVEPALGEHGVPLLAMYATERSENTFPALPVREDANVFVSMTMFRDESDHAQKTADLEHSPAGKALAEHLDGHVEVLRLRPTARSLLHG